MKKELAPFTEQLWQALVKILVCERVCVDKFGMNFQLCSKYLKRTNQKTGKKAKFLARWKQRQILKFRIEIEWQIKFVLIQKNSWYTLAVWMFLRNIDNHKNVSRLWKQSSVFWETVPDFFSKFSWCKKMH